MIAYYPLLAYVGAAVLLGIGMGVGVGAMTGTSFSVFCTGDAGAAGYSGCLDDVQVAGVVFAILLTPAAVFLFGHAITLWARQRAVWAVLFGGITVCFLPFVSSWIPFFGVSRLQYYTLPLPHPFSLGKGSFCVDSCELTVCVVT
jgi:hypothetical protein